MLYVGRFRINPEFLVYVEKLPVAVDRYTHKAHLYPGHSIHLTSDEASDLLIGWDDYLNGRE